MPRIATIRFCPRSHRPVAVRRPVIGRCKARRRSRVRARHHGLDGRPARRRQAQDLVDRDRDRRFQSRRRHPHGPRRLSRHRRRLRHQEDRAHPDIQDLYANLLELKARGGGDWPESVNEALDVAVNKLQWTTGGDTRRIVFLVGDAPPHMDYAQDTKYPVTLSVAKQKDIIVNAVLAGDARDTERVWRDIAQNGNGRFIPIPQDGGQVVIIETPYDEDIIILQREINGTVIPYGPRAMQKRTEGKTKQLSEVAAAAPAQASEMASYLNKRVQGDVRSRHRRWRSRLRRHRRPQQLFRHQGGRPARQSARDEARAAQRRGQQADEPAQGAQRKARRRWWPSATNTSPTSAPRRRRKRRRSTVSSRIR